MNVISLFSSLLAVKTTSPGRGGLYGQQAVESTSQLVIGVKITSPGRGGLYVDESAVKSVCAISSGAPFSEFPLCR